MSLSTVTATIQDPSPQIFANGTWQLIFKPTFGVSGVFTDSGVPFTTIYGGSLDNTGSFSQAVNRNDTISPAGSRWTLIVAPNANGQAYQVDLNVNSGAFNASAIINAVITNILVNATSIAHAYKDSEVIPIPGSGSLYYDVVNKVLKIWDTGLGSWVVDTNPQAFNPITHQFLTGMNAAGVFSAAQPVEADVVNLVTDLANINSAIALKAPIASPTFTGTVTAPAMIEQSLNGFVVVFADQYASIQAAINALPSTGGVVDARSTNVNLTMGAIDAASNSKPVTLLLGPFTYTFTQITVRQGFNILGAGYLNSVLSNIGTNANPAFVIPQVNNNAITIHWSDFQVLGLAGNTSQDGIFFDASTLTNAGVELSTFTNLQFTGFNGAGIHLKATQNGVSGSIGAIQGLSFFNVTSIRPTGATGATQNALRIEGGCGQIGFWNCWFTGASNDTGTNVFTGTNGTQAPYSIHHYLTTNQNGFAYLFDGAIGCTTQKDHFENIKGCYNFANTASPIVGFRSQEAYINSNVAVNAGNGYIVNIPNTAPSCDVLIDSPMIGGQPDNTIKNASNGVNARMLNAQIVPGNTPVNVLVSSGSTFQGTPAATLDIKCCKTVQLSASATSITTLKSGLMPGECVIFYASGGTVQFGTGGNLSLGAYATPLIIPSGGSCTFMRVDAGAASFVLVSVTLINTTVFKKGTGAGNYTSASTTDVVVDGTNLAATITIPLGWKLTIVASGGITSLTAIVTTFVGIADGGTIVLTQPVNASGIGNFAPFTLGWEINGDGASHTIDLRYHTSNGADSVSINNASSTQLPTMIFTLIPSN